MSFSTHQQSIDSHVSPLSSPLPIRSESDRVLASPGQAGLPKFLRASSISTPSGSLDPSGQGRRSSLSEPGQNAISTLLQPPIVRTGLLPHTSAPTSNAYKPPSAKDIPPVTLTNIPEVEPSAFKPYLTQVGSLYDAFQQAKATRKEDGLRSGVRENKGGKGVVISSPLGAGSKRLSEATTPPLLRQGSSESLRAWPAVRPPLRRSSTDSQRKPFSHNVPPLSSIPSVYFEEDFHLENPRTFDVVSERSDIVPRPSKNAEAEIGEREGIGMNGSAKAPAVSARKTLATNAILQEKLSWYMDTVEMHLISSISSASTSFFAALGSLRGLNSESQESIARIQRLRADLELVDRDMALGGLKVINMQRRRANVRKLVAAIEQLKQIVDEARTCQNLIDQGLIDDALDQVDKLEDLSAGKGTARKGENGSEGNSEAHEAVDLQGLKVLANLSADISNFRARIGKGFEQRFLDVLLGDLRRHVQIVSVRDTFQRWSNTNQRSQSGHSRTPSVARSTIAQDDELQVQLQSNINALHRVRHTPFATAAYRDAVLREAKNLIRKQLPSSDDDDTESIASVSTRGGRQRTQQEKSAILARNLRSLDPQEAEDLLARIYSCFVEFLRRLAVQVKVLLDVTSVMSTNPALGMNRSLSRSSSYQGVDGRMSSVNPTNDTAIRSQEDAIRHVDISSVLGEVVDIAQAQITKILKVRNEQTIRLPIGRFIRYFTLNRAFADDCELVSGRGGSALKSLVNAQIKDFVIQLGDSEKQCLARTMDADLWDAADFGERESQVLSRLLESSTKDPDAWLRNSGLLNSDGLDGGPKQSTNGAMTNGDASRTGTPNGSALPGGKEKIRRAVLDEQTYILPKSALATLDGVDKLESIIACIPSTTQEVSAILLDYLKLFTSRLCQLILGAGATRSAGLKNITTKHLALASQALSFIIALIPYIREFVRRHPTQSNTILIEFDKVKRLYQEHQNGIQDKFVEIMSGRSRTHVTALKKISWDDVGAQRPPINTYMETLIKETSTLHRVLSKHLSEVVVTSVMTPIFESYKEQWGQAFRTVNITTKEGMESLLRDAEAMNDRLGKINGFGDTGDCLLSIVKDRVSALDKSSESQGSDVQEFSGTSDQSAQQTNGNSDD